MKRHQPRGIKEIKVLLGYLNSCHDGSIKRISFIKKRGIDKSGNLVYLSEEFSETDIEIELILNSYQGAKRSQIVILEFNNVKVFSFHQDASFDYSDIRELKVETDKASLNFTFISTIKEVNPLTISCSQIVCIEK